MEALIPVLTELGLPGVVIVALAWFAWSRQKKADELQDARHQDKDKLYEALRESSIALRDLTDAVRRSNTDA